jgi:glycosyltransferase involved in cell wall biosynthesis
VFFGSLAHDIGDRPVTTATRSKIALIVPGGVDRSGEYRVIPALLALLARLSSRHEVHVFCFSQEPHPGQWELLGARVHNAGGGNRPRLCLAVLREHRRGAFDLIHSIWSGACSLVAVPLAMLLRLPSIVHVAGGELAAIPDIGYGGFLRARGRIRERLILRRATVVTAATPFMIGSIARLGVAARRVPLGVDLATWPALAPLPRDPREPARLLHVASLNRVKDQTTLLKAIARLRAAHHRFRLDIVGEDTLDGEIHRLASTLGLDDVVAFHGFMTQREWRPLAEAAHMLLMSSRHEAGPVVLLEAAVVGVPTVGTAVGHVVEWAPQAALAVPVGDDAALAISIAKLLDDEALRMRIARAAFERATSEDADHTAVLVESLYVELMQSTPHAATAR